MSIRRGPLNIFFLATDVNSVTSYEKIYNVHCAKPVECQIGLKDFAKSVKKLDWNL